jgi:UDP-N-acetyl-D-mannosaminouronate:lipid I N-acetyl-D-mannosaminouronosyltransferase
MDQIELAKVNGLEVKLYTSINHATADIINNYLDKASSAVAINPEKVILSKESSLIKNVLENNEVRYADGIGVVKYLSYKTNRKISRIPGCELWEQLMKEAGIRKLPVYLIGAKSETLNQVIVKLKESYSTPIVGFHDGYFSNEDKLINDILLSKAKIVSVALGSPKQELFIGKCKQAGVKAFFMGVGGTYDVFTGNVKRAPKIFCDLGLEWFYRLISQPSRIVRQRNLIKFFWLALTNKL